VAGAAPPAGVFGTRASVPDTRASVPDTRASVSNTRASKADSSALGGGGGQALHHELALRTRERDEARAWRAEHEPRLAALEGAADTAELRAAAAQLGEANARVEARQAEQQHLARARALEQELAQLKEADAGKQARLTQMQREHLKLMERLGGMVPVVEVGAMAAEIESLYGQMAEVEREVLDAVAVRRARLLPGDAELKGGTAAGHLLRGGEALADLAALQPRDFLQRCGARHSAPGLRGRRLRPGGRGCLQGAAHKELLTNSCSQTARAGARRGRWVAFKTQHGARAVLAETPAAEFGPAWRDGAFLARLLGACAHQARPGPPERPLPTICPRRLARPARAAGV